MYTVIQFLMMLLSGTLWQVQATAENNFANQQNKFHGTAVEYVCMERPFESCSVHYVSTEQLNQL
jgi:hypothetical protein